MYDAFKWLKLGVASEGAHLKDVLSAKDSQASLDGFLPGLILFSTMNQIIVQRAAETILNIQPDDEANLESFWALMGAFAEYSDGHIEGADIDDAASFYQELHDDLKTALEWYRGNSEEAPGWMEEFGPFERLKLPVSPETPITLQ